MDPRPILLFIVTLTLNFAYIYGNQVLAIFVSTASVLLYIYQSFVVKSIRLTKFEKQFIIVACVSVIALLPLSTFRLGLSPLYHFYNTLSMLLLAKLLVSTRFKLTEILKLNLFIFHFLILAYIFISRDIAFPLESMINGVSSNGITLFVLVLSIHYSIVQIIAGKHTSLLPALSCVYICYIGWGRTSMIVSLAYLLGLMFFLLFDFYYKLRVFNVRKLPVEVELFIFSLLIFISVIFVFATTGIFEDFIDILNHTKIGAGLYDAARASIIEDYINTTDWIYFISGGDYQGTVIDKYFRGNPHNTFIRAHYIFGLFYLIFTIVPLIIVFLSRVRFDKKVLSILLFSLFYIRSLTETIFYPTNFDVYIFIIVFLVLKGYEENASQK
ncbi:hypothetical protein NM22_15690 [Vibrio tubiashii]|nr:hypothetical protein NM22_15690 [Vibrio tubiashii]